MTKQLWDDLNKVVDYLYDQEKADFETYEEKPDNHMFQVVERINKFLLENPNN